MLHRRAGSLVASPAGMSRTRSTAQRRHTLSVGSEPDGHPVALPPLPAAPLQRDQGQDHVVRALRDAVSTSARARRTCSRAPRHGQDDLGADPRQGAQLRATGRRRAVLRVRFVPRRRARHRATTCTSSTRRATTVSMRSATSSRRRRSAPPAGTRCTSSTRCTCSRKPAEAALLKTLEEPPPHVVFVLATTDPQKVSDTIRSRTQHLRFHLLPDRHARPSTCAGSPPTPGSMSTTPRSRPPSRRAAARRATRCRRSSCIATGGDDGSALSFDEFVDAAHRARSRAGPSPRSPTPSASGATRAALTEELVAPPAQLLPALMAPELVQRARATGSTSSPPRPTPLGRGGARAGIERARRDARRDAPRARPTPPARGRPGAACHPRGRRHRPRHALDERIERLGAAPSSGSPARRHRGGVSTHRPRTHGGAGRARRSRPPAPTARRRAHRPSRRSQCRARRQRQAAPAARPERRRRADRRRAACAQVWSSEVCPSLKPSSARSTRRGSFTGDVSDDGRFIYELPNEAPRAQVRAAPRRSRRRSPRPSAHRSTSRRSSSARCRHTATTATTLQTASTRRRTADDDIDLDDLVDVPPEAVVTPVRPAGRRPSPAPS